MEIVREARAIRESVSRLEHSAATTAQWRQLDARVFQLILDTQVQLVAEQRTTMERSLPRLRAGSWTRAHARVQQLVELLDELHLVRIGVQSRIFEIDAAERQQRGHVLMD